MRQPRWDKYEAALLIDAYWRIKANSSQKEAIVSALSSSLRKRTSFEIDDTFRNENGIRMRLEELEFLFSGGKGGLKNTSDLFREMVEMYLTDKSSFDKTLLAAKGQALNPSNMRTLFCEWLQEKAPQCSPEAMCQLLKSGEDFCKKNRILTKPLFETTDVNTIGKFVNALTGNVLFRIFYSKQYEEIVDAANRYYSFIRILPELDKSGLEKKIPEEDVQPETHSLSKKGTPYGEPKLPTERSSDFDAEFYQWLLNAEGMAIPTCRSYVSALHSAESFAKEHGLETTLLCTADSDISLATASALMQNAEFRQFNQVQHNRYSAAFQKLNKYYISLCPGRFGVLKPNKGSGEVPREKRGPEIAPSALTEVVDKLVRDANEGITKVEICEQLSSYNTHQINSAIAACHAVLVLKKYYHPDNISDYQEMADILLEVISRQFSQNGNYTSAQQLYNEARAKLDDFFFYNNAFDSRQEVYDLAVHLFVQENYKGNSFIFMNNTHIWKEDPDYPKDYHGLLIKYAREHENVFSREEALPYFEQIGSPSPAQTFSNVIFNTGSQSFLQYSENQFVLTEALHVNDYFLTTVKTQIENLLEGEDYVAMGEIDDYFYTTLPSVPSGVCWSALLLEDLLRVHDIGFTTIEAGTDNDKKTIPAAIVRKDSDIRTFSDVAWSEVSKSFSLPKEFSASEFREFLVDKGFIRGSGRMNSIHKTVSGDIRFFWTDNNGKVTIN